MMNYWNSISDWYLGLSWVETIGYPLLVLLLVVAFLKWVWPHIHIGTGGRTRITKATRVKAGKLLVIAAVDVALFMLLLANADYFFHHSWLFNLVLIAALIFHIIFIARFSKSSVLFKTLAWYVVAMTVLIAVFYLFFPAQFSAEREAEDKQKIQWYNVYSSVPTHKVEAQAYDNGEYSVDVPLRYEAIEITNFKLEKGEHLIPLQIYPENVSFPGDLDVYPRDGMGAIDYYQESGKPYYLVAKNLPVARVWHASYPSHPFAKNDESVFGSLQMQLNGYWQWLRPPYQTRVADSTQPIIIGANLQRQIGHEGAGGYYTLYFRLKRSEPTKEILPADLMPAVFGPQLPQDEDSTGTN